MREDIIATETIFDGRIVHLRVHDVRLPDGTRSKRELIHHQGAVGVVALDAEGYVLLVRQYRIGAEQVMIEIPAGLLEPDEDPLQTAVRELREETGYRPLVLEALGGIYVAPGYTSEYIHLFFAQGYEHDPLTQDEDEFVETLRVPLRQALEMVERGEIFEAKSVIALLKVARRLGL
jgi:ADP-ribose pyrophosphatase